MTDLGDVDAVLQPRVRVAPATVGLGVERERPELGEAARPLLLRCSETRSVCASHTVISTHLGEVVGEQDARRLGELRRQHDLARRPVVVESESYERRRAAS